MTDEQTKARDQKVILALAHNAKPKRTIDRLTEGEKDLIAAAWDSGPEMQAEFAKVWVDHSKRWKEWLESNKATVDDTEELEEATATDE